jgi:nucleoside-diphosphate-sugar epimerase
MKGEYREVNQFQKVYTLNEMAEIVQKSCSLPVEIAHIPNPRIESESHTYTLQNLWLAEHGYVHSMSLEESMKMAFSDLEKETERLMKYKSVIQPKISWADGKK